MIPFHSVSLGDNPFKVGEKVKSLKTGTVYTVTKIVSPVYFYHDQATHPKYVGNYQKFEDLCSKTGQFHEWVDYGFRFTKEVCKHCDIEKGK